MLTPQYTLALHQANHPQTLHYVSDVFDVDPLAVTAGRPVGALWASPDCKHFSKAKGGKPVSKKIRSLAWVVVKWARAVRPRMIFLENVEEFQTWGPLVGDRPCPERKGRTFRRWKRCLQLMGYTIEHRELRACDYGAPTIRKRLFLVARCDGAPIVWPEPTHGAPDSLPVKARKRQPWRTAAACIDWSIPAPSIFARARPLADATCRRIAKGIVRYVIEAKQPFIVPFPIPERRQSQHVLKATAARPDATDRDRAATTSPVGGPMGAGQPAAAGPAGCFVPTLISMGHGERAGQQPRVPGIEKPHGTITAQGRHSALVCAFLAKHYTGVVGSRMPDPMATVTSVDHHSLVTAHMVTIDNKTSTAGAAGIESPLKTTTVENRHALVQAFLVKYYGTDQDPAIREPLHTITTRDRFGLVTVHGEPYQIVDIGLRMLSPRELYLAQGFPPDYRIDHGADGVPLTKTAQVRMCGNSVCPPLARAIVAANYSESGQARRVA